MQNLIVIDRGCAQFYTRLCAYFMFGRYTLLYISLCNKHETKYGIFYWS